VDEGDGRRNLAKERIKQRLNLLCSSSSAGFLMIALEVFKVIGR
jgi:hypothetical protein